MPASPVISPVDSTLSGLPQSHPRRSMPSRIVANRGPVINHEPRRDRPARPPPYHPVARPNGRGQSDGTAGIGVDHPCRTGRSNPEPPPGRRRGRPPRYSDRLSLKALVIVVVKHVPKVNTLLEVLAQDTPEM